MKTAKDWLRKHRVNEETGCWEWLGSTVGTKKQGEGYGGVKVKIDGRIIWRAHRLSFLIHNGYLDDSLMVCHTCDNPPCINPAHLFQGTAKINAEDMAAKGRSTKGKEKKGNQGTNNGISRYSEAQIEGIRKDRSNGMKIYALQAKYGGSISSISRVYNRKVYAGRSPLRP